MCGAETKTGYPYRQGSPPTALWKGHQADVGMARSCDVDQEQTWILSDNLGGHSTAWEGKVGGSMRARPSLGLAVATLYIVALAQGAWAAGAATNRAAHAKTPARKGLRNTAGTSGNIYSSFL